MWRRLGMAAFVGVGFRLGSGVRPAQMEGQIDQKELTGMAQRLSGLLTLHGIGHAYGGSFAWKQHDPDFRRPNDLDVWVCKQDMKDLALYRLLRQFDTVSLASNQKLDDNGIWAIARRYHDPKAPETFSNWFTRGWLNFQYALLPDPPTAPLTEARYGYSELTGFSLRLDGVPVDFIHDKPNEAFTPVNADIGVPVEPLQFLIANKMDRFRQKDIQDLFASLPRIFAKSNPPQVDWEELATRSQVERHAFLLKLKLHLPAQKQ